MEPTPQTDGMVGQQRVVETRSQLSQIAENDHSTTE